MCTCSRFFSRDATITEIAYGEAGLLGHNTYDGWNSLVIDAFGVFRFPFNDGHGFDAGTPDLKLMVTFLHAFQYPDMI
jgi:hypothetical protein